jgi:signal transduction histidine kinase
MPQSIEQELLELNGVLEACPPVTGGQLVSHVGFHSGFAPAADSPRWVQVDLGREHPIDSVVVLPACLNGAGAYGFPTRFRIETSSDALMSEPELLVETMVADPSSILPLHFSAGGRTARYVRFTAVGLVPQPRLDSRFIFCLGELLVFSAGRNVALHRPVLAPNSIETRPTWSPKHLVDGSYALGVPARPLSTGSNGWHSRIFATPDAESLVQVDLGAPHALDEIRLVPAHPRDYPDRTGFGFPLRFKLEVSLQEGFENASTVFECLDADFTSPGDTKVAFALERRPVRFIRMTAHKLWERSSDFVFALGELEALEGPLNVAKGAAVTASDSTVSSSWSPRFLVDGIGGAGALQEEEAWLSGLARRRVFSARREALLALQAEGVRHDQERNWALAGALAATALVAGGFLMWRGRVVRLRELELLRQQISRDLHDEIGSNLCSIRLMAEMNAAGGTGRISSEAMAEIRHLAEAGTESLRDMVWLLKEGGQPRIGVLLEKMRAVAGGLLVRMEWSFEAAGAPAEAVAPLSFHRDVLFILREALHNVVKHSGAQSVAIEFGWSGPWATLSIEDSGHGFDAAGVPAGDGIENMRHRAEQLKGTLLLESRPNAGTLILLKVPTP